MLHGTTRRSSVRFCRVALLLVVMFPGVASPAQEAPPLPFHAVEGVGGAFSTHSAYLVNPAKEGETFGLPSVGGIHVHFGHGRQLEALTVTETLGDRLELGYGWNYFDMGDLPQEIERSTGIDIQDNAVSMHNFNARFQMLQEGQFDQSWLPALTFGFHYKYNETIDRIDDDLGGTLSHVVGIEDRDGVDLTLYASKMFTELPRPVMIDLGVRSTEAAHIGLLGFTGERKMVFEGNLCVMPMDRFVVAFEYRQKPDEYDPIPGLEDLVRPEDDWWTLCAGYIVNDHMTLCAGYAHFGEVLNHEANCSWGVAAKYEF